MDVGRQGYPWRFLCFRLAADGLIWFVEGGTAKAEVDGDQTPRAKRCLCAPQT